MDGTTSTTRTADGPGTPRWARARGCVDRVCRGAVLVGAPDRDVVRLVGSAGLAWLVLEQPGRLDELAVRALAAWPQLVPPVRAPLADGLGVLVEAGLVVRAD